MHIFDSCIGPHPFLNCHKVNSRRLQATGRIWQSKTWKTWWPQSLGDTTSAFLATTKPKFGPSPVLCTFLQLWWLQLVGMLYWHRRRDHSDCIFRLRKHNAVHRPLKGGVRAVRHHRGPCVPLGLCQHRFQSSKSLLQVTSTHVGKMHWFQVFATRESHQHWNADDRRIAVVHAPPCIRVDLCRTMDVQYGALLLFYHSVNYWIRGLRCGWVFAWEPTTQPSLSPVGMGEDSESHPLYHIAISMWIFFGLAWLSGVITSIQHTITSAVEESNIKIPGRQIMVGITRRLSRHKDQNGVSLEQPEGKTEEICSIRVINWVFLILNVNMSFFQCGMFTILLNVSCACNIVHSWMDYIQTAWELSFKPNRVI